MRPRYMYSFVSVPCEDRIRTYQNTSQLVQNLPNSVNLLSRMTDPLPDARSLEVKEQPQNVENMVSIPVDRVPIISSTDRTGQARSARLEHAVSQPAQRFGRQRVHLAQGIRGRCASRRCRRFLHYAQEA